MHDIIIEEKILAANAALAAKTRAALEKQGVFAVNIVSSPGAGKTSLIERSAEFLKGAVNFAVIEGDLQTDLDAQRISRHSIPVKQITTGRACHLDAHQVSHALPWALNECGEGLELLIIENVGNMVCPAEYDLGEDMMITVMSAAEGDDKPLKYPAIFAASSALVINKTDLLAHTDFDIAKARENALRINPYLRIFEASCKTGEGVKEWCGFLAQKARQKKAAKKNG